MARAELSRTGVVIIVQEAAGGGSLTCKCARGEGDMGHRTCIYISLSALSGGRRGVFYVPWRRGDDMDTQRST